MKINLPRMLSLMDIRRTTQSRPLIDFYEYMSQFVEQMIRFTRGNVTFEDNIKCSVVELKLRHNVVTTQPISGAFAGFICLGVVTDGEYLSIPLSVFDNKKGGVDIKAGFVSASPTTDITVKIAILLK